MKRLLTLLVLTLAVTALCFAGSVTGYVTDAKCAKAGKAGEAHAGCAKGCISGGEAAVVVTEDGKIYEVADQAKVKDHAGAKVTVMGMVEGMKITSIDSVKKAS
jgi:hypothetical protein